MSTSRPKRHKLFTRKEGLKDVQCPFSCTNVKLSYRQPIPNFGSFAKAPYTMQDRVKCYGSQAPFAWEVLYMFQAK